MSVLDVGLYDSHCHLDFEALAGDLDAVVERALAAGLRAVLVPGVDAAQWRRSAALCVDGPTAAATGARLRVRRAVGFHPGSAGAVSDAELATLDAWLDRGDAAAVGELGWDARLAQGDFEAQDRLADLQIEQARARRLPVILHVVGAHGHALARLARHGALPEGGVVHAYSGSAELVPKYVALGLSISFGPSITRSGTRAAKAARAVPDARLLLETDAPDQRPPGRPRGEPEDLRQVADAVARARGWTLSRVAEVTAHNAAALFG